MKAKKMIAASSMLLALVCATGGYITVRDQHQAAKDNALLTQQLSEVEDIVVKEGESLPNLKEAFADASMVDQESIRMDIQNVDSCVPGTYDVVCSFNDVRGNQGEKIIQCEVQPDLVQHVSGLEDLTVDCGGSLSPCDAQYDEYVESVIRDDSMVDLEVPGTYTVSYSILGTNGEIEEVERLVTVLNNKPEPSPTPVPEEKKDKTAEKKAKDEKKDQEEITGNVEVPKQNDHAVATGDESKTEVCLLSLAVALAGMFWCIVKKYRREI